MLRNHMFSLMGVNFTNHPSWDIRKQSLLIFENAFRSVFMNSNVENDSQLCVIH